MDREELASFLRHRRERLMPADVGLPVGVRRRTPGLRRDEVAALAGRSTDYYTRMEQGRSPHPSPQLLRALARALRLTTDERDYLYRLAGHPAPAQYEAERHVGAGLLHLLSRLNDTPAFVVSDLDEVLVQNPMAVALLGDVAHGSGLERNFTWRWFTDRSLRDRYPPEDWDRHAHTHVADLRATAARRRGDADVGALVNALRGASPEFAALWDEHEVAVRHADTKRIVHPEVGAIDVVCETLLTPSASQRLLVFYPRPGTDAREKLDLLRVIGTQNLLATPS